MERKISDHEVDLFVNMYIDLLNQNRCQQICNRTFSTGVDAYKPVKMHCLLDTSAMSHEVIEQCNGHYI